MGAGNADLIAAGVFLAALIMVRKFQSQIKSESGESFRHLAAGLAFLSLSTVARLLYELGLFEQVPFLTESLFFDLFYWILVIAGGSLIANGLSEWLPLARRNRRISENVIKRLDLLRRVEQLVGVENRLDTILANTLQYMRAQTAASAGAVFKLTPSRTNITLAAVTQDFPMESRQLEEAVGSGFVGRRDEEKIIDAARCLRECLPEELGKPAVVLPIEISQRPVGFFVLWNDSDRMHPDDRLFLQLAADVVARKIDRARTTTVERCDEHHSTWLIETQQAVLETSDSRRRIAALARGLAQEIRFDSLAVSVMPVDCDHMTRYSYGHGGRVLIENHLPLPTEPALTAPAYRSLQMVVHADLDPVRQPVDREIITSGVVRSLLAQPIKMHHGFRAVLTLASGQTDSFGPWERKAVLETQSLVALALMPHLADLIARRELARMEKVAGVANLIHVLERTEETAQTIAGLIAEETGADFVRISALDATGAFLESRAVASSASVSAGVPAGGLMILSLMPQHARALETCQTVTASLTGGENLMASIEARQAFSENIKSCVIVPIMSDSQAIGTISIAGVDDKLTIPNEPGALVFVEALASIVSGALKVSAAQDSVRRMSQAAPAMVNRERMAAYLVTDSEDSVVKKRLKAPPFRRAAETAERTT